MEDTSSEITSKDMADVRSLGQWTRRYVQSRSVPVFVGLAVFGVLVAAMLTLWSIAGNAYRSGDMPLLFASGAGLAAAYGALLWLSVPSWGGRRLERLAWRYYDREGQAAPRESMPRDRMRLVGAIVASVFGACILVHVALGFSGVVSDEMALPISALYVVPFLTFVFVATRTYVMLLYPFLYGIHGAAIGIGLPDPFAPFVSVEFRTIGAIAIYGAIAVVTSHVYNRIALSRMSRYGRGERG